MLTFECQVEHDVFDQSADADPVEFDDPTFRDPATAQMLRTRIKELLALR